MNQPTEPLLQNAYRVRIFAVPPDELDKIDGEVGAMIGNIIRHYIGEFTEAPCIGCRRLTSEPAMYVVLLGEDLDPDASGASCFRSDCYDEKTYVEVIHRRMKAGGAWRDAA